MMKLRPFEDHLQEMLRDSEFARAYMEAALQDGGIEDFLDALREVAATQGERQEAFEESNPCIKTVDDILHTLGMRIAVARAGAAPQQQREPGLAAA